MTPFDIFCWSVVGLFTIMVLVVFVWNLRDKNKN